MQPTHTRRLPALCRRVTLALGMSLGLTLAAGAAMAAPFSQLVVFGDSLSDPGNAYAMTGGAFPPAPYGVTFSNGPTAVQYMAQSLGLVTTNYAVGGAMTNGDNYLALTIPSLAPALGNTGISAQIANWDPAGLDAASTLFMVWGGPNDFSYSFELAAAGVPVDFGAVVTNTVTNMANDILALRLKGAQNFFVPYMPDLGLTPRAAAAGADFAALASAMSNGFNTGLSMALAELQAALGITVYTFDTAQFMRDIIDNPPAGLTDLTTPCIAAGAAALASGCAGYEYFDDIHPTTYAHSLIGQAFAQAVPEPMSITLAGLGLVALAVGRRRRAGQALLG